MFAVIFGGESGLQKLGLCGIHPLTQRYAFWRENGKSARIGSKFSSCNGAFKSV
ncbi:hypothetical protein CRN32_05685 [Vibrio vulnificus]|nr:hypothetical protein CRN32_05685 [Vibrio vulnificus]